jgi:hypothetical protein
LERVAEAELPPAELVETVEIAEERSIFPGLSLVEVQEFALRFRCIPFDRPQTLCRSRRPSLSRAY